MLYHADKVVAVRYIIKYFLVIMKYFLIHDEITLADDILPREPAVCGT